MSTHRLHGNGKNSFHNYSKKPIAKTTKSNQILVVTVYSIHLESLLN